MRVRAHGGAGTGTAHFADDTIRAILIGNGVTLVVAIVLGWGMLHLMWPLWIQTVVIGVYSCRRILALQKVNPGNMKINGRRLDDSVASKRKIAGFFALHCGGFHFGHLVFLLLLSLTPSGGHIGVTDVNTGLVHAAEVGTIGGLDWLIFAVLSVGFWRTHRISHHDNLATDLQGNPTLGQLMFMPYARIVAMHLTLIFGAIIAVLVGLNWIVVAMFMLLKTLADVTMHLVERRVLRAGKARPPA